MAKVYMTFDPVTTDQGFVYAGVYARAIGVEGFSELAVWLPFPNEPSGNTIRNTLITYALSEIESATGVNIPQGQVVTQNEPV